jgi:hypothetical protein
MESSVEALSATITLTVKVVESTEGKNLSRNDLPFQFRITIATEGNDNRLNIRSKIS